MAWQRARPLTPEQKSADVAAALARGQQYLAAREYSSAELYQRLCDRFTQQAAAAAIASLIELGWLDDGRYAAVGARSQLHKNKSRRAAANALRGKGISKEMAAAAVQQAYAPGADGQDPELAAACRLAAGVYRRRLAEGREDLVAAALYRRGFGWPVIRAAMQQAKAELAAGQLPAQQ